MENDNLKKETANSTNTVFTARCSNGHTWTYAGSIHYDYDLENHPCDCGAVLYHSEPCQCCGQRVVKPSSNVNELNDKLRKENEERSEAINMENMWKFKTENFKPTTELGNYKKRVLCVCVAQTDR